MDIIEIEDDINNFLPNVSYNLCDSIILIIIQYLMLTMINFQDFVEEASDETIYLMMEKLRVGEVQYSALPMEYPPTSNEGIAIVYNIETWDSYESAFNNVRVKQLYF